MLKSNMMFYILILLFLLTIYIVIRFVELLISTQLKEYVSLAFRFVIIFLYGIISEIKEVIRIFVFFYMFLHVNIDCLYYCYVSSNDQVVIAEVNYYCYYYKISFYLYYYFPYYYLYYCSYLIYLNMYIYVQYANQLIDVMKNNKILSYKDYNISMLVLNILYTSTLFYLFLLYYLYYYLYYLHYSYLYCYCYSYMSLYFFMSMELVINQIYYAIFWEESVSNIVYVLSMNYNCFAIMIQFDLLILIFLDYYYNFVVVIVFIVVNM